jgi:hypothetical protein
MTNLGNRVRGSVALVTCKDCHSQFPRFEFETETDVGAIGFCSASSCNQLKLVIAETTLDEWNALSSGELVSLPPRLSDEAGERDLHVLHVKRIDKGPQIPAGLPFAEFRKLYRRPTVIYDCPCCGTGEAIESEELTVTEFEARGGHIRALGNLYLER